MKIFKPSDLHYINYLLLSLDYLTEEGSSCDIKILAALCASKVFGGKIINYGEFVKYANSLGLVRLANGKVSLSENGAEFVSLNREKTFEISIEQKHFFAISLVFSEKRKRKFRNIFSSFSMSYEEISYILKNPIEQLPPNHRRLIDILLALEIVSYKNNYLIVTLAYVREVRDLRAVTENKLTQEELSSMLEKKRLFGFKAEELIVDYEIARLKDKGFVAEASRVHRISELDAAAGYDIESFDGEKIEISHSRFIEVKASQNNEFQFHWSKNEIKIAKKLGAQYWIYFLPAFSNVKQLRGIQVLKIQDPYEKIFVQKLGFETLTKGYLITHPQPEKILTP